MADDFDADLKDFDADVKPKEPTLSEKYAPTKGDTVAHGALQGASYGLADEAQGVLGGARELKDQIARAFGGGTKIDPQEDVFAESHPIAGVKGSWDSILDAYRSERDAARREDKAAAQANPKLSVASTLGGALVAPGPKGAAVKGAVPRALQMAKQGLQAGAAYGAGDSEADLTKPSLSNYLNFAKDTAEGAGLGGVTGGMLGYGSAKLEPVLKKAADLASFKSFEPRVALGGLENKLKSLEAKSPKGDPLAAQRALGRTALDEGITVPFGTSEGAAKRAEPILDEAGTMKGDALGRIRDEAQAAGLNPRVSLPGVASTLENAGNAARLSPGEERLGGHLLNQSKQMRETGMRRQASGLGDYLDLLEAESAKSKMQKAAFQKPRGGPAEDAAKQAASAMRQAVEDEAERVAGPEELSQFKALKDRYGRLADISDIAEYGAKRAARREGGGLAGEIANRMSLQSEADPKKSLTGWAMGQALDAWKNRRPATMAHVYDQASKNSGAVARGGTQTLADYLNLLKEKDDQP